MSQLEKDLSLDLEQARLALIGSSFLQSFAKFDLKNKKQPNVVYIVMLDYLKSFYLKAKFSDRVTEICKKVDSLPELLAVLTT